MSSTRASSQKRTNSSEERGKRSLSDEGEVKSVRSRSRRRKNSSFSSRSRSKHNSRIGVDERSAHRNAQRELYKTKLCEYYPRCPDGDKCNFAHSKEEIRKSNMLYKTAMCRRMPNCKSADLCNFAHSRSELRSIHRLDDYRPKNRYRNRSRSYSRRSRSLSRRSRSRSFSRKTDKNANLDTSKFRQHDPKFRQALTNRNLKSISKSVSRRTSKSLSIQSRSSKSFTKSPSTSRKKRRGQRSAVNRPSQKSKETLSSNGLAELKDELEHRRQNKRREESLEGKRKTVVMKVMANNGAEEQSEEDGVALKRKFKIQKEDCLHYLRRLRMLHEQHASEVEQQLKIIEKILSD